jgi:hypothetical protein
MIRRYTAQRPELSLAKKPTTAKICHVEGASIPFNIESQHGFLGNPSDFCNRSINDFGGTLSGYNA